MPPPSPFSIRQIDDETSGRDVLPRLGSYQYDESSTASSIRNPEEGIMKIADHSTFAAGDTDKNANSPTAASRGQDSEQDRGSTTIADVVVQKIAGLATREVPGVYELGGGASRAFGAMKGRIPGASASAGQGVSVEVGQKQAAIDLQLLVEYGASIPDLSRDVRNNVIDTVGQMTGLEVVEVNINVNDVHLPGDDGDGSDQGSTDRVE